MDSQILDALFRSETSVCTDTRTLLPGQVFIALSGPTFDGNSFATKALESGASRVVIDNQDYLVEGDDRYLLVDNCLEFLQKLALNYRNRFEIPVIGITGTNGKTTTKELLASILQQEKRVHFTQGNLNNHIGVPLTLLSMPADTEIAIIEMGANKPGDIKELCEIAVPTHGIITNIGYAHLERFGDIDGVEKTKGELFEYVKKREGMLFVNLADERVAKLAGGSEHVYTYGNEPAYCTIYHSKFKDGINSILILNHHEQSRVAVETTLNGKHNLMNVLAAATVACGLNISKEAIRDGIEAYVPENNRSQWVKKSGFRIYMDAYNANPSSMEASISSFFEENTHETAMILGDMFELGNSSVELHTQLGHFLNNYPAKLIICVGKDMFHTFNAIKGASKWYATTEECIQEVKSDLAEVETLFIKGSRGMRLERVLECLG